MNTVRTPGKDAPLSPSSMYVVVTTTQRNGTTVSDPMSLSAAKRVKGQLKGRPDCWSDVYNLTTAHELFLC